MDAERLGFWARIWLAIIIPWIVLFNGRKALRVRRAIAALPTPDTDAAQQAPAAEEPAGERAAEQAPEAMGETAPTAGAVAEIEAEMAPSEPDPTPALQLLAILQREGRFVDFLQEEVAGFSDAEIGAAARVVHEGCKRGLDEYLVLSPVRSEAEGDTVVLERGFDPTRTRVTGNVVGEPPFRGRLAHHGWQVAKMHLPELAEGHDPRVVAPAEVEL